VLVCLIIRASGDHIDALSAGSVCSWTCHCTCTLLILVICLQVPRLCASFEGICRALGPSRCVIVTPAIMRRTLEAPGFFFPKLADAAVPKPCSTHLTSSE
jgi:hypothetical protein